MRLGIAFIPGFSVRESVELAVEAEALGFDHLYIPDQTFHRDPAAILAACAQATSTIQLGLGVTNPYSRHPIQIARAAGTLTDISEGRFTLGIGAGNGPHVLRAFGLTHERVIDRVRGAVGVIRRLLAGETVSYDGPGYPVHEAKLDFVAPTPTPIYLASRNPAMLALSGEVGDGVLIESLPSPAAIEYASERLAAGAARGGHADAIPPMVSWQMLFLGDDPELAHRPDVLQWASAVIATTRPVVLGALGLDPRRSGDATPQEAAKIFSLGTAEAVAAQLDAIAATSVQSYIGVILGDASNVRESMRRLAKDVRPQLRESQPR